MRKAAAITAIIGSTLFSASSVEGSGGKLSYYESAKRAVCFYFGDKNCDQAMKIVKCETGGTYWPWVSNGQYLGIFQMGSSERAKYGHGNNVWAQAKAAYHYFLDAGWGPWLNYQPPGCGD